jgi:hypothetical protein
MSSHRRLAGVAKRVVIRDRLLLLLHLAVL